ncbi:hypothetical protein ACP4OV_026178 [Aristida adscensionis]
MNSAFSEDVLADKLAKLNNTQQCIEKQIVQTWDKQFHGSGKEQKVPFLYLANDILQNSKRNGTEFVEEFWKVLPGALKDVTENGDDRGKKVASRLVDIWQERRVFGSRAGGIKDVMLGTAPLPVLDMTKKRSHSSGIKIVKRDSRSVKLRLGVGGTAERIVSALHTVSTEQADEDVDLEKCMTSMRHVGKMEKDVDSACSSKAEDPRREVLCTELKDEEATMKKCIEKLKVVEANRATVVSELKEALQEQESELEKVRTQLQLAEAMVHEASNMQRRLKNEPVVPLPKAALSVEPGKELSNGQVKEQQKTAAAILADKIAASSNSQQILQSALSKFAEETKNSSETRTDKRQKVDQSPPVPSVANAAAFVPMPQMVSTTAQQQPQAILVQQTPMQSQAPAPQPQYNMYQAPPQQFVQQPGGVMMGMPYNMNTMTPPPRPPQMMNLGRTSASAPQQQMSAMPQTQPPAPPVLQQQMPMNVAPQMQFTLQQPPFRPMQPPPGMQFFHPQSQ